MSPYTVAMMQRVFIVLAGMGILILSTLPDKRLMDDEPVYFGLLLHLSSALFLFFLGKWCRQVIDDYKNNEHT